MTDPQQALATYADLQAKVDAKFAAIRARHPAGFACVAGCHSCCQPGLTVSAVEASALGAYLAARPELAATLRALESADPFGGARCAMLDADGRCGVYAARPLVCRSHGAPLVVRAQPDQPARRDVCPLNFRDGALAALPDADTINLDTLNTLLALLNQQHSGAAAAARVALRVSALCPLP